MSIPISYVEFLRQYFPRETKIRLLSRDYDPRLTKGDEGILAHINDEGGFVVNWQKGFTTTVTPGEDGFTIRMPDWNLLKLYMPITAEWADDSFAYDEEDSVSLSDNQILNFEDAIQAALVRNATPEEFKRGIMHWYSKHDTVNVQVEAVRFKAEERNGKLWCVAECGVHGTLLPQDLDILKEYIAGQAADGWGEGFEQRAIQTGEGEIYVHLWNFDDWDIKTEEELFAPKIADGLPPLCFSTLPTTGELICIKRGESGYYPSDWSTSDPVANRELADFNNQKLGVTYAQRLAMECGSMHGWNVPGADPASYPSEPVPQEQEDAGMTMGGM